MKYAFVLLLTGCIACAQTNLKMDKDIKLDTEGKRGSYALGVLMGGAAATHLQRGEPPFAPLVLGLLSLVVAWLRRPRQR